MTYTFRDLCGLFQQSPTSNGLRRRLKGMVAAGFPPPLPGLPQRWSKPAVDAWLHNWGTAALSSPALRAGEAPQSQAIARDEGQRAPANITTLQQTLEQIYH